MLNMITDHCIFTETHDVKDFFATVNTENNEMNLSNVDEEIQVNMNF